MAAINQDWYMNLTFQELKNGNEKLGLYKAEWLSDKIFDYFSSL